MSNDRWKAPLAQKYHLGERARTYESYRLRTCLIETLPSVFDQSAPPNSLQQLTSQERQLVDRTEGDDILNIRSNKNNGHGDLLNTEIRLYESMIETEVGLTISEGTDPNSSRLFLSWDFHKTPEGEGLQPSEELYVNVMDSIAFYVLPNGDIKLSNPYPKTGYDTIQLTDPGFIEKLNSYSQKKHPCPIQELTINGNMLHIEITNPDDTDHPTQTLNLPIVLQPPTFPTSA